MKRNEEMLYLESDPEMFDDRFARCRRLLHFLAARILGSRDEAEDAVRNCRAAASRNPPSFESEGAFRSWLVRILIDEACALLRRNPVIVFEVSSVSDKRRAGRKCDADRIAEHLTKQNYFGEYL